MNKSTVTNSVSTRAITGINCQVLGLTTDSRKRRQSTPCLNKINQKVCLC